jgi:hypothetical protein
MPEYTPNTFYVRDSDPFTGTFSGLYLYTSTGTWMRGSTPLLPAAVPDDLVPLVKGQRA